ncbi:GGDEF domain-containing protein [Vibrio sp. 99-8-1]|uniref:GGDEF domain-containing protein n=1 Tax=Vibrio sp. 99-8-1 TaxID=2607602 RepID=UPI001493D97C|nr:GGDEF domain-containing protein [Vibrio sp. 99-8-1]NOI68243.1 GGDEF domain-containing protein [Vibrio sp. 99-8-1]
MKISDQFDGYKTILETLPDRVFIISQSGIILDVMGGDGSSIVLNKHALVRQSLNKVFGNDKTEQFDAVIQRAIKEKTVQVYQYSVEPDVFEKLSSTSKIDSTQWYEGRIQLLPFKVNDEAVVVWISRNTTQNHLLQEKLKQQAELDYLTGVLSHRSFFDRAVHCFKCKKRYCKATTLLLLDIDHFKSVNDTYGHLAGDAVLKNTATTLQQALRDVDYLGRVGGEEFAVLLTDTDVNEAYPVAERIREKIEQMLTHYKTTPIQITISIGISDILSDDSDITVAYERADKALYQSKLAGRNRTTVYQQK